MSSKSERAGLHFYENDGEKLCNDLSDFFYDIRIKKKRSKRFCIIKFCVSGKRKVVVRSKRYTDSETHTHTTAQIQKICGDARRISIK